MVNEELFNITRVEETYSHEEANKLLEQGWKLLNVYTGSFSLDYNDRINMYVLGKMEDTKHI